MRFWNRPKTIAEVPMRRKASFFSTHAREAGHVPLETVADVVNRLMAMRPRIAAADGVAMDASDGSMSQMKMSSYSGAISDVLGDWYASQTFIGFQMCAILAQHWLIAKACSMPGRDAIRGGFDVVSVDGDEVDPEVIKKLRRADRAMKLNNNLEQFIRFGRVFGIRIAMFKVDGIDYEKPFNIDGVKKGAYKGIVQVDPYWCSPMHSTDSASRPDEIGFYEPEYWQINGKRYHRSHLIIYRHSEVADLLKPQYQYGGVSVPQQIMERVYAAERVANEAPELVQTKRTNVWLTDLEKVLGDGEDAANRLHEWIRYRDNYSLKLGSKDGDEFQQFDTSLADLDTVIMTQYQIVAAAANVPVTKLLGTSPKGFNATGEFEEASYHEELESIQTHDLTPLVERHHALVMKSEGLSVGEGFETTVNWRPLDAPTAKELAETNLIKAQAGQALVASGAIASEEERQRVVADPEGGYSNLGLSSAPHELEDDLNEDDDAQAKR